MPPYRKRQNGSLSWETFSHQTIVIKYGSFNGKCLTQAPAFEHLVPSRNGKWEDRSTFRRQRLAGRSGSALQVPLFLFILCFQTANVTKAQCDQQAPRSQCHAFPIMVGQILPNSKPEKKSTFISPCSITQVCGIFINRVLASSSRERSTALTSSVWGLGAYRTTMANNVKRHWSSN